jgi:alginate biosynthesis protein AlgX
MIRRILLSTLTVFAALLTAASAAAQSAWGCTDLDGRHAMPAVEGSDGIFFRIDPDLMMYHPVSDRSAQDLARLSATLAENGTTLIYVPLPTLGLIEPEALPPLANDLGFDHALAATVFDMTVASLVAEDVLAVNLRNALRGPTDEGPSTIPTDYRLNTEGGRRAARAIGAVIAATPGFAAMPRAAFESRVQGPLVLPSRMRDILQRHCTLTLPPAVTTAVTTTRTGGALPRTGGFLGDGTSPDVVLVGPEEIGTNHSNLAGFLSEATGLTVLDYIVDGGGAHAAISAYLTSRQFQDNRPAYLVWVNPVQNNLAARGDQPFGELVAAAGTTCTTPLPVAPGFDAQSIIVDLLSLDPGRTHTIFLDTDAAPATLAKFDVNGPSGLTRTRHIARHPGQVPTGRFYLPLTGFWPEGAQSLTVGLDVPFGLNARVMACSQ